MPTLSFWFKECELRFRQEARRQEKRLLPPEVLTRTSTERRVKKPVKGTKGDRSFPTPSPNTADDFQKEADPVTFRNY